MTNIEFYLKNALSTLENSIFLILSWNGVNMIAEMFTCTKLSFIKIILSKRCLKFFLKPNFVNKNNQNMIDNLNLYLWFSLDYF